MNFLRNLKNFDNATFYLITSVLGIIFGFGTLEIVKNSFKVSLYLWLAVAIAALGLFFMIVKGRFTTSISLANNKKYSREVLELITNYCKSQYTEKEIDNCISRMVQSI